MTKIENLIDVLNVSPSLGESPSAFFMVAKVLGEDTEFPSLRLDVVKVVPTLKTTDADEVINFIEQALNSAITGKQAWGNDEISIKRAANEIARNSRRGVGNHSYNNKLIYIGTSLHDRPFQVFMYDDTYHVAIHPGINTMVELL